MPQGVYSYQKDFLLTIIIKKKIKKNNASCVLDLRGFLDSAVVFINFFNLIFSTLLYYYSYIYCLSRGYMFSAQ